MHGNKKRRDYNHKDDRPKQKKVKERDRSTIKSRLRNLEDNWEMVSEKFIKEKNNES